MTLILNTFKYIYKFANILTHVYDENGPSPSTEIRVYIFPLHNFMTLI